MKMVRMYHDDPVSTGGPTSAEVPVDGVAMMRRAGWYIVDEGTPDIEYMTIAELRDYAKSNDIQIPSGITAKADIIEHVKSAQFKI